jgi:hypothetical protein
MLVKVPLMGDARFYMMLQSNAVWAAIPNEGSVLLHLVQPLNWPLAPEKVLSGELGPTDLIIGLHQYAIADKQGGILPARLPMADVCKVFSLVPFSAAAPGAEVPIGIHPGWIFAYAPSYDKEGNDVGTNIYCTRPFAKVGNLKVHVTEKIVEVTMRLGVKPEDLLDLAQTLTVAQNAPAPQTEQ